jgi:hypothetical protein
VEAPFRLEVFDGAFARKGFVGNPVALTVTPRHNQVGTATLVLDADHVRVPDLSVRGARVVIRYDDLPDPVLTGRVRLRQGEGPLSQSTVTFSVVDDLRLLWRVLGWPVPTAALSAQTAEYDTRTGAAETVLKQYVTANAVQRLGLPVTVAATQARGATITASLRMHPLADRLLPLVDAAGIGVTVRQSGAGLLLDCYTPATHPRTLTEQSGIVQKWSYSQADPEATRVVAGGQGEGVARVFRSTVAATRETQWRDVIEVFRDARDAEDSATLDLRSQETLDEGAPRAGLSVELAETATFRYGKAVRVGDRVRIEVGGAVVVEDVLREAVLSWTRDDGLLVTPIVGQRTDDPDTVLARAVAALGRSLRNLTGR